jgi:hypothetical protein
MEIWAIVIIIMAVIIIPAILALIVTTLAKRSAQKEPAVEYIYFN